MIQDEMVRNGILVAMWYSKRVVRYREDMNVSVLVYDDA